MKLYAQQGYGDGEKTARGLSEQLVDGVILSPRDVSPERVEDRIQSFLGARREADILLDPQFYATFLASHESARTGKLTEWPHFRTYRKSDLETSSNIKDVLRDTFEHTMALPLTAIIAPNIYISRSFDSRDAVIAKNFIREAKGVYSSFNDARPLYATLAVSREALLERSEFEEFLNDITVLSEPPDGFYVLVGSRGTEVQTDIFHTDVIARWMLLNHSLAANGLSVINGYSDLLMPVLGAVGATAGASGWWSNLRAFSLDRFGPGASGGRQPIKRYLSLILLNRITFSEKDALRELVPEIINRRPHDSDYDPEPDRPCEMLQSWEALRELNSRLVIDDVERNLSACLAAVEEAENTYLRISQAGLTLDRKSSGNHLMSISEGIASFKKMAGLR